MPAPEGNKYAQKHTLEEWTKMFEQVYEGAISGKYDSLQRAWIENDIRPTTVKYLVNRHEVLSNIKEDIANAIVATVNTKALEGDFQPTASIWRMKQLGEKDQQYQQTDVTTNGESINKIPYEWNNKD